MVASARSIGIIGGSGMLGGAMSRTLLDRKIVPASDFWISSRSGSRAGFEQYPEMKVTRDNTELGAACEVIILCVPPALAPEISIHVPGRLVVSVMAGIPLNIVEELTGSDRVVRAMSSPAAAIGLAYSPWIASPKIDSADRARVTEIFQACGSTDEIEDETHLDHFTALTGPVPGFVAFYAECMIDYAVKAGISPTMADRAVRQLFLSAGAVMAHSNATPSDQVQEMIDYAGTTAAGLLVMKNSSIADAIAEGLDAAVAKARKLG
ncbi:pyrroline-5-carboxylate reductase dimerization domain-containing protein [Hoeflea sp. YIM 152468]|uniref:pyrroline-5-carboxylate reductase family protein n=1 Tax=Hoeflea sp. YIM 152468 TaxID=3031759 RepID=UPI0023DCD52B|nr:pyrroline-5-carboxylate reductase dimerization domain-containing protein [Hoeflea sp. YIM 152468]MDF1607675.1 pyrroline-5-carboxylate reductase dimerization domain-containing protein [Hoeflea sp. YIM 152468]